MTGWRRLIAGGALAVAVGLAAPVGGRAAAQDDEAIDRLRFEASQLAESGDLEGALQKYALLSQQFPAAPAAAEALLEMVLGNRELERLGAAEEAARTLVAGHPRSPQAAGAYTLLGQLLADRASDEAGLEEARETLENAVLLFPRAAYPDQPWRAEAAVRGARIALMLGREAAAARALADVIDLEPRSRWTAAARLALAELLLEQGAWEEAAGLFQQVVDAAGDGAEERAQAEVATRRLGLVHRLWLRPAAGQDRWQASRLVGSAPERPAAVAVAPDGRLAVSGGKGSTVELDADGSVVARWSHEEPRKNAWRGGELLVTTPESADSFPARRNLRFAAPPSVKKPTLRPLVAVEPAPFGRWLVIAAKPPRLLLYEPGRRLHRTLVEGKGREPVDLASDRRGGLLLLDEQARTVTRFTLADERGQRLISGDWDRAAALSVDAAGHLYVLDRGRGRVEMFDRAGGKLASLGPSLPGGVVLERPADLAVDGAGRLWIANGRAGLVVLE